MSIHFKRTLLFCQNNNVLHRWFVRVFLKFWSLSSQHHWTVSSQIFFFRWKGSSFYFCPKWIFRLKCFWEVFFFWLRNPFDRSLAKISNVKLWEACHKINVKTRQSNLFFCKKRLCLSLSIQSLHQLTMKFFRWPFFGFWWFYFRDNFRVEVSSPALFVIKTAKFILYMS